MGYSVRADSELIFGHLNISKWADLNNDEDAEEISDRVDWAIQLAYDKINGSLKFCKYTVPFELDASVYDPLIVDLSARLTGVILYDNRKLVDIPEFDEVNAHREMVDMMIKQIHSGQLVLVTYTANAKTYPIAIPSEA